MNNPFPYWHIAEEESFCNRTKELADLLEVMKQGGRAFIYAERRTGKTSLVKRALSRLPEDKFLSIYIDLWAIDSEESFISMVAKAITKTLDTSFEAALRHSKALFTHLRPSLSLTEQGLPQFAFEFAKGGDRTEELEDVLHAPERISKRGKKVVIVFDEFQQIVSFGRDTIEKKLRSIIQQQSDVSYVFMGSRKHLIQGMFLEGSRPLYRSATQLPLGPIHEDDWNPFIMERFRLGSKSISAAHIHSLMEITQGHPFYTQYLCHVLWDLCPVKKAVSGAMLSETLSIVLQREEYMYGMLWQSLSINQQRFLKAIAQEDQNAKPYSAGFLQTYNLGSASSAQRVIQVLLEKEIIDQDGSSFYIVDRFFRFWLLKLISN